MATHPADFGRASALPLSVALSVIPSLPRPLLSRFVARAIDRLDELAGDPDLEPDDFAEEDDAPEDNGDAEHEPRIVPSRYGTDQRIAAVGHGYRPWHIDREEQL